MTVTRDEWYHEFGAGGAIARDVKAFTSGTRNVVRSCAAFPQRHVLTGCARKLVCLGRGPRQARRL